jgi:L,D-transpeptidase catalytic domain
LRPLRFFSLFTLQSLVSLVFHTSAAAAAPVIESIAVSVPEQRLYTFDAAGVEITSYRISTSQFGTGDMRGSYTTPLGQLQVVGKIGDGSPIGTVFKGGARTGEICPINARGRDPIVTRILRLRGLEKHNSDSYSRAIYIHGTPDERHLGKPMSWGCIRMRSCDVITLFNSVGVGIRVEITEARLSGGLFAKAVHPLPAIATGPEPKHGAKKAKAEIATKPPAKPAQLASVEQKRSRS